MARSRINEEQSKDVYFLSEKEHTDTEHLLTSLADTPTTFSGSAKKYLSVNVGETGVEFITIEGSVGVWKAITTNYSASSGDNLFLDTTSGTFTVVLPSSPDIGAGVAFIDGGSYCSTNAVTISRAGEKIMGLDEDFIVDTDDAEFNLVYYNTEEGWRLGTAGYCMPPSVSDVWIEKTANYTASNGDKIFLNSGGGVFIITMPLSPSMGDTVSFIDGEGHCATNNITISGSGEKIMGLDESMDVNIDYATFGLVYYDSDDGWILK